MVPAPPPPPSGAASFSPRRGGERTGSGSGGWPLWLLLGFCFGVGHGVTQRLLDLRPGEGGLGGHQTFGVKAFPGTSLDGLRRSHRDGSRSLRPDLDAVSAERQKRKESQELERRQAELERRDQEEAERRDRQAERLRLEELQKPPEPAPDPSLDVPPLEPLPPPATQAGTDDTRRP